MAIVYTPPGVTVDELLSSSVRTALVDGAQVAIVGAARGYQTGTATTTVATGTTAFSITAPVLGDGTETTFVAVDGTHTFESAKNQLDPTQGSIANQGGYAQGGSADFTAVISTDKKTITVTPVADSDLADNGGTVKFVFRYVPENYFVPIRLDTQSAIENRFGVGLTNSGVGSPLSHAAAVAIQNGAASVVCVPLFDETDGVRTASADATDEAAWASTLASLRDYDDINILVLAQTDGSNNDLIAYAGQNHLATMVLQGQYIVQVVGVDSQTAEDVRGFAMVMKDRFGGSVTEQIVFVSPTRFARTLPGGGKITVGGQYMAAAIAGMIAARPITASLTRKAVAGFSEVLDTRDQSGKNADAQAGLLVLEQKGRNVQVRHAITLDTTSTARREISVVRAKHHMLESLRNTIDTQIIGDTPADGNAPTLVSNTVISVLEALRSRREIVDYNGVQSRIVSNDPTTVEVRFSYRPAFPLNYVHITFSLDLSAGITSFDTATV